MKIIIDTDPGIDDAIAICYAIAHPQLDVVALTSIFGNLSSEQAAQNALRLCKLTGTSIPVARGADKPLIIEPHPHGTFVHGTNGFGNIELPLGNHKIVTASAAELIVEQVREYPSEITLVAVGPLTNLALALELAPDIADNVQEVIIMGGVFNKPGNVSQFAEANIWNDPHAARQVLTARWPVIVHGLDVTLQIAFDQHFFDKVAQIKPVVGNFLRDAAQFYFKFYSEKHNFAGCCPHDLLPFVYMTNPQWFDCQPALIEVVTTGDEIGRTTNVINNENRTSTNKKIALQVNREALLENYLETIAALPY